MRNRVKGLSPRMQTSPGSPPLPRRRSTLSHRGEGLVRRVAKAISIKGGKQMPEITVNMATGRTDEQKAGMMRDITQPLVKNLGVDAEAVVIQINEAPLTHKMKGGKTFVERAAEQKK